MGSLTLCLRNSKPGRPSRTLRLSADPVMKLSSARTCVPRLSRASQRCDPMKPAPPETTARGVPLSLVAADTPVSEAHLSHLGGHINVAAVDHDRPAHRRFDPHHVKVPELVPLGDDD